MDQDRYLKIQATGTTPMMLNVARNTGVLESFRWMNTESPNPTTVISYSGYLVAQESFSLFGNNRPLTTCHCHLALSEGSTLGGISNMKAAPDYHRRLDMKGWL